MKWQVFPEVSRDVIVQILHNRGIDSRADIEEFLNPKLEKYDKELDWPEIKLAHDRILDAIKKGEKVVIYGDYDVDGICASAIVYKALKSIGCEVKPYIPHRVDNGYGLSRSGIDDLLKHHPEVKLIITVDNGIVAHEGLNYANELGIEVIVSDHHHRDDRQVKAKVVVHKETMCGSAVAWCLVRWLIEEDLATELLQLAAIGTIADVMPMIGVNRALVVEGMERLRSRPNLGLKVLIKQMGQKVQDMTAEKISFEVVPKLNAAGRMDSAMPALRMLCFSDVWKVGEYAENLVTINEERKLQTKNAISEAMEQVGNEASINVVSGKWHPGVVGLVAARICETTHKPTLAIALNDGGSRGSARSVNGVNIIELLRQRAELFRELGGHSGAAGFSIDSRYLQEVRDWLRNVELGIGNEPVLEVDMIIPPGLINEALIAEIEQLAPFGLGNPKPVFGSRNVQVSDVRLIGQGQHLKMSVNGIDAVGFGMGDQVEVINRILADGGAVNVAYRLEINEYRQQRICQMKLIDISG